jgi:hypothetical protein
VFVNDDGLFIKHVIKKDNLYGVLLTWTYIIFGWCFRFQVFVITTGPNVVLTHGVMYWISLAARKLAVGVERVMTLVIRIENLTEYGF